MSEAVLAGVRAALAEGRWDQALELLDDSGAAASAREGLELRAQAAYGAGRFEESVDAWEQLCLLLVSEGDDTEAARAAVMIAMYLMMDTGLMAPVRGWVRRAERLLEGHAETPAHALLAMVHAYERFMCGDMDAAGVYAAVAIDLGSRLGVAPAEVIGRVAAARVRIFKGDVDKGFDELDEIGALLMSGHVDALTTGMMYCELICAAQSLSMYDRAREWTAIMEHWRHGAAFGGINGRCRVHRAEVLRITGPCDMAEEEALEACAELRPWMRREFGWPLVELGNIRLRKGDLHGAEEAFVTALGLAWSPQPGLALLRLAQGEVQEAATLIADAIAHPFAIPWKERPPFGELCLAPLLDAQAEIAGAAGDSATAKEAAGRLAEIADRYPSTALQATAALAEARALLLDGRLGEAIDRCNTAIAGWAELGAPFEIAVARTVLSEALRRSENPEAARLESEAARASFIAFGAPWWAEHAEAISATVGHRSTEVTMPEPTATFALEGDTRVIRLGATTVRMRDLKGLRYLQRLLADPDREFHALDLVAVERGALPTPQPNTEDLVTSAGEGLPVLDERAREAYRRRLAEVEADIEEAVQLNDPGRRELAERDREYLVAELAGAVGLGGRHRVTGSTAERARTSVTRSIRYALDRLADHDPAIAQHFRQAVQTGTYCCYRSDPLNPVGWRVH